MPRELLVRLFILKRRGTIDLASGLSMALDSVAIVLSFG